MILLGEKLALPPLMERNMVPELFLNIAGNVSRLRKLASASVYGRMSPVTTVQTTFRYL